MEEFKLLSELGLPSLAIIAVIVMSIVLYRSRKPDTTVVKLNGQSQQDAAIHVAHESANHAHKRLDDMQIRCSETHMEVAEKLSTLIVDNKTMKTDISWIKSKLDS